MKKIIFVGILVVFYSFPFITNAEPSIDELKMRVCMEAVAAEENEKGQLSGDSFEKTVREILINCAQRLSMDSIGIYTKYQSVAEQILLKYIKK